MESAILNGKKSVLAALQDKDLVSLIEVVYLTTTQVFLQAQCKSKNIRVEIKEKKWFLNHKENLKYRDIVAVLKTKHQISFDEFLHQEKDREKSLVVILDKIQDATNFGAILRSCAASDVKAVFYAKNQQCPINTGVLRSSQGYALKVNVIRVSNINNALAKLKENGFWSYVTTLSKSSQNCFDIEFAKKSVIIFGNEGDGVSELLEKNSDFHIQIPLKNNVDSLNVSVCAGIVLFQYVKNHP